MKKLQLPSSYAVLSEEEQRIVSGGGEFKDAVNEFLDHLHLQDLILGRGLISFSISFVPMMLFTVVKTGFNSCRKDLRLFAVLPGAGPQHFHLGD